MSQPHTSLEGLTELDVAILFFLTVYGRFTETKLAVQEKVGGQTREYFKWKTIRDIVLLEKEGLSLENYRKNAINVKVTRSLNRLVSRGLVARRIESPRNVLYAIINGKTKGIMEAIAVFEDAKSADVEYESTEPLLVTIPLPNIYEEGDSFSDFKDKFMHSALFDPTLFFIYSTMAEDLHSRHISDEER